MFRFIPRAKLEDGEQWVESMVRMEESITENEEDINLYVLLNSDDAADTFIVLNMLDILVSMPESGVHLKKIYTVRSLQKCMAGIIRDDTDGFGVTELFHAIRAFLNYGKADMIADIWEKSGEQNESIADMVYAMRDVDAGLSMCNVLHNSRQESSMIIKNEIPILEYDDSSSEVITPNHDCEDLVLPEKCLFAFLGDVVHEYAEKNEATVAETLITVSHDINIYVMKDGDEEICLVQSPIGAPHLLLAAGNVERSLGSFYSR